MATETQELTEVQTVLDGLSSPSDEEFVQAVRAYSDGAVAAAAAKLALAGGGGGGGAGPDFLTPVTIRDDGEPTDGNHVLDLFDRDDAGPGSHFDTYGQFTGQAVLLVGSDDSDFASGTLVRAQASSETSQLVALMGPAPDTLEFFIVDENGVTTISPGGTETLKVAVDQLGFFGHAVAAQPEIPATPSAQDIADALVALGLATQAA